MISILIVEDNLIVRNGLVQLLEEEADFRIAACADNGPEALQLLQNGLQPDVVITDLNMQDMDGIELLRQILAGNPEAKVIILTMHRQSTFREKALAAGAKGYLLKGEDFEYLFAGIRVVYSGKQYTSPGLPESKSTGF